MLACSTVSQEPIKLRLSNIPTSASTLVIWGKTSIAGTKRIIANCHTYSDNNGFQVLFGATGQPNMNVGNGTTFKATGVATAVCAGTWLGVAWTYDGTTIG